MDADELFFENETRKHQQEVARLLMAVAQELLERASWHDESKMREPERETFIRVTPQLRGLTYGSEEYHKKTKALGPALYHHYTHNRHHPEYFDLTNMHVGMNLVDAIEMFCDWMAATKRHDDGDIEKSIEHNQERFGYGPYFAALLRSTAEMLKNV